MEPHRSLPLSPSLGDPGVRRAHYTCPDFLTSGSQERLGPWCEEPGLNSFHPYKTPIKQVL